MREVKVVVLSPSARDSAYSLSSGWIHQTM